MWEREVSRYSVLKFKKKLYLTLLPRHTFSHPGHVLQVAAHVAKIKGVGLKEVRKT